MRAPTMTGLVLLAGLSACGGAPPTVPATVVEATVSTTDRVNAGANGAAAPLELRIYQLASGTSFDSANFFPLYEKDAATLKTDLVRRDDLLLGPSGSKTLTLMPEDRAKAIGVFAAYRDYERLSWHTSVPLPPHVTSKLTVTAGADGLKVTIAPEKPAAPAK